MHGAKHAPLNRPRELRPYQLSLSGGLLSFAALEINFRFYRRVIAVQGGVSNIGWTCLFVAKTSMWEHWLHHPLIRVCKLLRLWWLSNFIDLRFLWTAFVRAVKLHA